MMNIFVDKNTTVITINGVTKLFAINNNEYLKGFKATYDKQYDNVSSLEELNQLDAQTWNELEKILGEDIDSSFKTKVSKFFFKDVEDNYFIIHNNKVNTIPIPKKLGEEISQTIQAGDEHKLEALANFWKRCIRKVKDRPFKVKMSKLNNLMEYAFKRTSNKEIYNALIEKGFSDESARRGSMRTEVGFTSSGNMVTYKVIESRNYLYQYDKDGNIEKRWLFKKESLDQLSGKKIITEIEHTLEEEIFEPLIYKNGDEFYTAVNGEPYTEQLGYIIKVGKVHYHKDWDKVNCNDRTTCVRGHHVGGTTYVLGWARPNAPVATVVIDPANIGAVCISDYVLRVKEYYISSITGAAPQTGFYNISIYNVLDWDTVELYEKEDIEQEDNVDCKPHYADPFRADYNDLCDFYGEYEDGCDDDGDIW